MNIEQTMEMEDGERITTRTRTIEDEHYWRHLERPAAVAALPEVMRQDHEGELDLDPSEVANDAVLYARALIARLKGEG